MNIRKFKEIVSEWENSEERFRLFRVWVENSCIAYIKSCDFALSEEGNPDLDLEYGYVDYEIIVMLYSKMGWKLDGKALEPKEYTYCRGVRGGRSITSRSIGISFPYVYEKIQEIKDNIEFAYAITYVLISNDDMQIDSSNLSDLLELIGDGLREYDLISIAEMIENEKNKKIFIAMSFDDSMEETRMAIIDAARTCGYFSMLIDVKEHNNQIVPEIYKEINDSEFVIADLTGQRGGVYFEAGYAVAKGKELILCCKQGEKTHFDVAQINTIFWKDEQDLKVRLIKRIEATIGRNA